MWLFPGAEPGALLLASGETGTQAGNGKNDVEDVDGDKGGGKVKAVRTEPSSPAVSYMTVYVVEIC